PRRAGLSPHGRQACLEPVLDLPQPGGAAVRDRMTIGDPAGSADEVEERPDYAASVPDRGDMPAQPRIEPEAAAGGVEREEKQHDREEDVGPRPLRGTAGAANCQPPV